MRAKPFLLGLAAAALATAAVLHFARSASAQPWSWTGGVTESAATVVAELDTNVAASELKLTLSSQGREATTLAPHSSRNSIARFALTGLAPDSAYTYVISAGDRSVEGAFRTFPAPLAPASFTFALGSCMKTGTVSPVFTTIAKHQPRFMLFTGDFHYRDIAENDPEVFLAAYRTQLTSKPVAALLRSTSVAYVWDDHDFGPNDSDSTSPSRVASTAAYRAAVPHYPLRDDSAIHQAFTFGRARFVMADLRSQRLRPTTRPTAGRGEEVIGTMMSQAQIDWLKAEIAESARTHAVVFFVSSSPWIDSGTSRDSWNGYRTQRRELSEFFRARNISNLAILCGDAHAVAFDDGTNSDFSNPPLKGPPVFHAAALDQTPSKKGGPYTHGMSPGQDQFGLVSITDTATQTTVTFSARNAADDQLITYIWQVPARP
jgi:phosphodiesterase/alkaline phosphatase D-like protein